MIDFAYLRVGQPPAVARDRSIAVSGVVEAVNWLMVFAAAESSMSGAGGIPAGTRKKPGWLRELWTGCVRSILKIPRVNLFS